MSGQIGAGRADHERTSLPEPTGPPSCQRRTVVGIRPWLPWPLSRWRVWNEPGRAERAGGPAYRPGLGAAARRTVHLSAPRPRSSSAATASVARRCSATIFGRSGRTRRCGKLRSLTDDLKQGKPFDRTLALRWRWSLAEGGGGPGHHPGGDADLGGGDVSFCCSAWGPAYEHVVIWVLSTSFANVNPYIDNAGDVIRGITAVLSGAVSVRGRLVGGRLDPASSRLAQGPVYVYPWVICLLFLQMVFIYWCNGVYKLTGADWQQGNALYYVLGDLTLTRWSSPRPAVAVPADAHHDVVGAGVGGRVSAAGGLAADAHRGPVLRRGVPSGHRPVDGAGRLRALRAVPVPATAAVGTADTLSGGSRPAAGGEGGPAGADFLFNQWRAAWRRPAGGSH